MFSKLSICRAVADIQARLAAADPAGSPPEDSTAARLAALWHRIEFDELRAGPREAACVAAGPRGAQAPPQDRDRLRGGARADRRDRGGLGDRRQHPAHRVEPLPVRLHYGQDLKISAGRWHGPAGGHFLIQQPQSSGSEFAA
jgi:hypothetical protein